jgi:hypothetical protein
VAAHWVSRCDGFRVVVGHKDAGTVERAVFNADPLDPVALRIRRPHGQTRLIPLTELESVEPLSRIVYFRKRPGRGAVTGRRVSAGATQLRRSTITGMRRAAISSSRWTVSMLHRSAGETARNTAQHWPAVRRALLAGGRVALGLLVLGLRFLIALLVFATRTLVELVLAVVARFRSQPTQFNAQEPLS